MTAPEQTDFEDWPAEADLIRMAALPLIEHIFAASADGSAERSKAMDVVLTAIEKIKQALASKPRLQ
jgi:hypothetical protein